MQVATKPHRKATKHASAKKYFIATYCLNDPHRFGGTSCSLLLNGHNYYHKHSQYTSNLYSYPGDLLRLLFSHECLRTKFLSDTGEVFSALDEDAADESTSSKSAKSLQQTGQRHVTMT